MKSYTFCAVSSRSAHRHGCLRERRELKRSPHLYLEDITPVPLDKTQSYYNNNVLALLRLSFSYTPSASSRIALAEAFIDAINTRFGPRCP